MGASHLRRRRLSDSDDDGASDLHVLGQVTVERHSRRSHRADPDDDADELIHCHGHSGPRLCDAALTRGHSDDADDDDDDDDDTEERKRRSSPFSCLSLFSLLSLRRSASRCRSVDGRRRRRRLRPPHSHDHRELAVSSSEGDKSESAADARHPPPINVLLLGTRQAGKSAFRKQLQRLHACTEDGCGTRRVLLPEPSVQQVRLAVQFQSAHWLCELLASQHCEREQCEDKQQESLPHCGCSTESAAAALQRVRQAVAAWDTSPDLSLPASVDLSLLAADAATLWSDPAVLERWQQRPSSLQVPDCAEHFLHDASRVFSADYAPSDDDFVRFHSESSGFSVEDCLVCGQPLRLVDFSGAQSQRRKWLQHAREIEESAPTLIIFLAALDDHAKDMWESCRTNRLADALDCFRSVITDPLLTTYPVLLLFTKPDLLAMSLQRHSLASQFGDEYSGDAHDTKYAQEFLTRKFLEQRSDATRRVYVSTLNVIDTRQVQAFAQRLAFALSAPL